MVSRWLDCTSSVHGLPTQSGKSISSMATRSLRSICYPTSSAKTNTGSVKTSEPDGLFWQYDVRDGMEEQISGSRTEKNARPTINSYMAGNAAAIANIAEQAGRSDMALKFRDKATSRTQLVRDRLWNRKANFFEALRENQQFAEVREQIGYVPWYFQLATAEHDSAWQFASDEKGFLAPYGLTTAERSHPQFRSHGCCNCEWDGAVWPFATSQTLTVWPIDCMQAHATFSIASSTSGTSSCTLNHSTIAVGHTSVSISTRPPVIG